MCFMIYLVLAIVSQGRYDAKVMIKNLRKFKKSLNDHGYQIFIWQRLS